jgi:hypothetical protein
MPKDNHVDLIIIVNGQPIALEVSVNEPLKAAVHQALAKSGNSGQPIENWELRDGAGNILDLSHKVGTFHFPDGTKLFLSLKAGIGG